MNSLTRTWERYFLKESLKIILLFLFCFFGLYILIDYASHARAFSHAQTGFSRQEMVVYYLCECSEKLDVIAPFAILIGTIRTLTRANQNGELIALMAGGIPLKRVLRPFLLIGLAGVALIYVNNEWISPGALKTLRHLDNAHDAKKNQHAKRKGAQHLALEDGSLLVFQEFDKDRQVFHDAWWVESHSSIYKVKTLIIGDQTASGKYIIHFIRDDKGKLVPQETQAAMSFPGIRFNRQSLLDSLAAPEEMPLSTLWLKVAESFDPSSEKEAQIASAFTKKLAIPWLCLIAVIGPIPFCARYNRQLPIFMIYCVSLFALVALNLLLDAGVVLGERQVAPPFWSIAAPLLFFFFFFGIPFQKIRHSY